MRWGFRVATDPRFGGGHLARCAALASALGDDVALFRDPEGHGDHSWASSVVTETAAESLSRAESALREGSVGALIVDGYAFTTQALADVAAAGRMAAFRDTPPYGAGYLTINPNPGCENDDRILGGPGYMPLQAGFARRNQTARQAAGRTKTEGRILIAFGARDSDGLTMMALDSLETLGGGRSISVVLADGAPHLDAVARKVSRLACSELHRSPADMGAIYEKAELAIGAPGVSQFERACCGLPAVLIPQNDRQRELCQAWALSGAAEACEPRPAELAALVEGLIDRPERIHAMRECAVTLIDGRGAARLADALKRRMVN